MKAAACDAAGWASVTMRTLEKWAGDGPADRGRRYRAQGRIDELVVTDEGHLLATVEGTIEYIVTVQRTRSGGKGRIRSQCTCPVGYDGCKHAVAVVLEAQQVLAGGEPLTKADPDDPRWDILGEYDPDNDDIDDEGDLDDDDGEDEEERAGATPPKKPPSPAAAKRKEWDRWIREHLRSQSKEELAEQMWRLAERFPDLRAELRERLALRDGNADRQIAEARRELKRVTSIQPWRSGWTGAGVAADYGPLKRRLERLVEMGHADEVVKLGRDLIRRGTEQVGISNDEGDTARQAADCLTVVFEAVKRSSLSGLERLLFAIDALLTDDYDIVGEGASRLLGHGGSREDWSGVADALFERLKKDAKMPALERDIAFSRSYKRDQLSGWLLEALKKAGRRDELLPVYEAEARITGSYQRLVDYLIAEGKEQDARRWALEGIAKTRDSLPGIANGLAASLCGLAKRRKDWQVVAAHAAHGFLERPSAQSYRDLCIAARKAKCETAVRALALRFLETGASPIGISQRNGQRVVHADAHWPLPAPEELRALWRPPRVRGPRFDVLIDLAIDEKRPDDVLRWHDAMQPGARQSATPLHWRTDSLSHRVAEAVSKPHPERALAIYEGILAASLKEAHIAAYEEVASCLRKMRPVYKQLGLESHWRTRVSDLCEEYRRRPRLVEILGKLDSGVAARARRRRGR